MKEIELHPQFYEVYADLRRGSVYGSLRHNAKNFRNHPIELLLVDATLCPAMKKPFDVLAEGLVLKDSGGGGN
jgi:hypothetical protein